MLNIFRSNYFSKNVCLSLSWIHFTDEKDSGSHGQDESTIVSDNIVEKYSSDEYDSQESSEEVKSSGDDGSFENETLGNHIASQSDISRDHCLHDQGQYEHHYASLHFNNPPRGYISKMCEMYYGSKTCPFGGNQGAWNHTGIKF